MPQPATSHELPAFRFSTTAGDHLLEIWSGGFCEFSSHPTNHSHVHTSYHELCLVTGGSGQFVHGTVTVPVRTGDVFVSDLNTSHEISSFRTMDLRLVFICFARRTRGTPDSSDATADAVRRFYDGHAVRAPSHGRLEPWLAIMLRGNRSPFASHRCESAVRMFVLEAMDLLAAVPERAPAAPTNDICARALDFVERNIRRQFSIEELAEHCCCSSRHLRRVFAAQSGQRLVDTISERRMRLAAQDLLMRFPAGHVARSLGFSSAAHFTRLFARYHGLTPKRFQIRNAPRAAVPKTEFDSGTR